jgi:hypothetical protein
LFVCSQLIRFQSVHLLINHNGSRLNNILSFTDGSRRVEKDEAGCFHQRQASRQLREFAQQARRRRRNDVVDLASRREDATRFGQLGVDK